MYGVTEIAQALGVSRQAVHNLLARGTIPEPDARLAMGPVWKAETIEPWIKDRRMKEMGVELTTYSDGQAEYEAIQLTWRQVREILGRDHEGSPEDDQTLVQALLAAGAPAWVQDAEGWIDEYGWGLIGPEIPA